MRAMLQRWSWSVVEVMKDVKTHANYRFKEMFGEDAFCDRLEDVVRQYRQQFNVPVPSQRSDPTPRGKEESL